MTTPVKYRRDTRIFGKFPAFLLALVFAYIGAFGADTSSRGKDSRLLVSKPNTNVVKRLIVMLRAGANSDGFVEEHGIKANHLWRHAYNGFVADIADEAVQRFKNDPQVGQVIEDGPAATYASQIIPVGVQRLGIKYFPPVKVDGSDKRVDLDVAVIDSGIQADHPDLNVVQSDVFGYPELVDSSDSHGTSCAGIIGALDNSIGVVGVAPGARLWSVRASSG